ncbi:MAG TPA: MBL fold metallo-hydrolase [Anaerolineales bacterium]|nr:MBL fold metallo-hydrolase [Anaerolineales bacterium]HMX76223.1 MBL fold metallo-hydrolase [Anaerolineales bacterium]HNC91126.1 MBL fold metallo-hydrolase [Anaerolineales bacterium]HUM26428.1 MBL fold metallo-hydrolase [Anaerolineales bacterium]
MKINILHAGYCTAPEHIAMQGGRWRTIHFPAMFALFRHPKFGAMLFDTGYSYRFFDETKKFPKRIYRWMTPVHLKEEDLVVNQLSAFNLQSSDISHVFVSHFHADHVGALCDLPKSRYMYFPHAFAHLRHLPPEEDMKYAYLRGQIPTDFDARSQEVDMTRPVLLAEEYAPFKTGYDLLGDGSIIGVELPGHALGQMGIFARDENGKLFFFVADAAWLKQSIVTNRPPHKIANLLFPDPALYRETLGQLHTYYLTHPDTVVVPSHCDETIRLLENAPQQG